MLNFRVNADVSSMAGIISRIKMCFAEAISIRLGLENANILVWIIFLYNHEHFSVKYSIFSSFLSKLEQCEAGLCLHNYRGISPFLPEA